MKSIASAPGKIILFGEHFVVHGTPAILAAIDKRVEVTTTTTKKETLKINSQLGTIEVPISSSHEEVKSEFRPFVYLANKIMDDVEEKIEDMNTDKQLQLEFRTYVMKSQLIAGHAPELPQRLKDVNELTKAQQEANCGLEITIHSDIPIGVGLGSSSACCVAAAASIFGLFKVGSSKEILNISIEAEKTIFPDTSGADCAVCTYGGMIVYDNLPEIRGMYDYIIRKGDKVWTEAEWEAMSESDRMLLEMRPDQTEAEWKASVKDYGSFSNGTVSRETVSLDSAVMDQLEIAGRLSPELVAKRSTLSMDQAMNDVTSGETARITGKGIRHLDTVGRTLNLLIANSMIPHTTKNSVGKVRKFKENNEERFSKLCADETRIIADVIRVMEDEDEEDYNIIIGNKMEMNQRFLKEIQVSNDTLDDMIRSLNEISLGSKITGAGDGGCIIALVKDENMNKVPALLGNDKECFSAEIDDIGVLDET